MLKITHLLLLGLPLIFTTFLIFPAQLVGQEAECGYETPPITQESFWQTFADARVFATQKDGVRTPTTIPLRFTVLRDDEGNPAYRNSSAVGQHEIDEALINLNDYFAEAEITFIQCGPISFIDKTSIFTTDQPRSFFSFSSHAIDVIIGDDGGARGWATHLSSPTSRSYAENHSTMLGVRSYAELDEVLAHEMGHKLGLLHTFDGASLYDNRFDPIENSPGNFLDNPQPYNYGRELVIRDYDPSAPFHQIPNHHNAGDRISDTPAWGRYSKDFPNPDVASCFTYPVDNSCSSGILVDYHSCNYIGNYRDYNNQPLENADIAIRNLMSYTPDHCRMEFTQGQMDQMIYINETIGKTYWWQAELCSNLSDRVEYKGSSIPVKNVTVAITHPHGNGKHCRTTSDMDGNINGVLFDKRVKTKVAWLGSGEPLRQYVLNGPDLGYDEFNDEHYAIFDYTYEDWTSGITTSDLILIGRHLLQDITLDGYDQIAADLNNDGKISTMDLIIMQSLILGKRSSLEQIPSGPWRFVPEYIPYAYEADFHANPFGMTIDGVNYQESAPYLLASWEYEIGDGNGGHAGFDAIKVGDINGDVMDEGTDACPPQIVSEVSVANPANQGEVIHLSIQAKHHEDELVGFQFGWRFDPTVLEFVDLELNDKLTEADAPEYYHLKQGKTQNELRLSWYQPALEALHLSNEEAVVTITLRARVSVTNVWDYISLDDQVLATAFYNKDGCSIATKLHQSVSGINSALNLTDSETSIKSRESTLAASIHCSPNPSNTGYWTLTQQREASMASLAQLIVYNLNGEIVHQRPINCSPGTNNWLVENTNLPAGIYLIKLRTPDHTVCVKAVKG